MKILLLVTFLVACPAWCRAQGTLVFDQQSSTNPDNAAGSGVIQQLATPYGQSFTPALSGIDFVMLGFYDAQPGNGLGATVFVNLRSGSIGGPVIGYTSPISMRDGFGIVAGGVTNLLFLSTLALVPGQVYYLQPVVQAGDLWGVNAGPYGYPAGSTFLGGAPLLGSDYWFLEGIIVPEPACGLLALLGAGAFFFKSLWQKSNS
jgi:hypothetical protein